MKKILFILIAFLTLNVFAQPPGGRGRRGDGQGPSSNNNQKAQKFNASNVARIFYYDIDKAIKKTKVKKEEKQLSIKKIIKNYNLKIKEISFLNSQKFSDLNLVVNSGSKNILPEERMKMRKKVNEIIRPIRDEIHELEKELNNNLEEVLTEKQFKKWLKYQKTQREKLMPKRAQNGQGQRQRQGGMNNGRGMRRQ
ncbi:hypothetical protein [Polaribacter sp. Z022]|uniref:hypothetical protein n=1 Tax=Polaribacter sp. Z022 TaxID=2927125 RepID=UPI00202063DD|nr:hypothetical protein [Polaribacter sp. Z022]MCL7753035.1 hypothetical protein [Polaribacter sp. Z022]